MPVVALEPGQPQTIGEAFAHIGTISAPTISDLKVMVLVEAASEELYRATANNTDLADVADLLNHNGREERRHAHRVSQAIAALGGGEFPVPDTADNPYLAQGAFPIAEVTPKALRKLAQAEFSGEAMYAGWAATLANEDAAALLRQNGSEETDHGNRLLEAAALLEGAA